MISFTAGSMQATIRAFDTTLASEREAAVQCVDAAGSFLHKQIRENISMRCHTLAQLAALDHPYAVRHGRIMIHRTGSKMLLHPEYRVHTQSGQLLGALRANPTHGGLGHMTWLDAAAAPHAEAVVSGTDVMLPRDVLWDTALAPAVQREMMRAIIRVLGKKLRTKASIRFGTGVPVRRG